MSLRGADNTRLQKIELPAATALAFAELMTLQQQYADCLATLPKSLRGGTRATVLEAIADLDLTALADIELPRGYGGD